MKGPGPLLVLLLAALAATSAHARRLAQASSDAEPFNPYTATPGDQPALEIRVGIGGGADVRVVNETVLPGLAPTDLTTHLVTLLPCSSLAPHYHPTADEMQWVMEGSLQLSVIDLAGDTFTKAVTKGDVNIIPKGLAHTFANENCEPATVALIFSGTVSRVNLAPSIIRFGQQMASDVLGVNSSTLDAPMGDIISITASDCPAKCEARRR